MTLDKKFSFSPHPPASSAAISDAESELGIRLPEDYRAFLMESNGGEGFLGDGYVQFWKADELAQTNLEYGVAEFLPGFVLIGSNGGGMAYGFRVGDHSYIAVPFGDMSAEQAAIIGSSFDELVKHIKVS